MKVTNTVNVEFDVALSMDLITGQTLNMEMSVSFDFDMVLTSEVEDETLEAALIKSLDTEQMAEHEKEIGQVLIDLLATRLNVAPFTIKEVKNVVVTRPAKKIKLPFVYPGKVAIFNVIGVTGNCLDALAGVDLSHEAWQGQLKRFLAYYFDPDFGSVEQYEKILTDILLYDQGQLKIADEKTLIYSVMDREYS